MSLAFQRTILLFTRAPEAEARAKGLPVEAGSRLFEAFLAGWRERAREAGAELVVAAPPQSLGAMRRLFPEARVAAQQGASFAARMEAAFALGFARGADSVLMAGGDSPPLDREEVEAAFAHLASHERALALAPASDGGVNVIGFNAATDRRLEDIVWFGADVERQLLESASRDALSVWLSASSPDLDRRRDVPRLYRLCSSDERWRAFRGLLRRLLPTEVPHLRSDRFAPRSVSLESRVTRGPPPNSLSVASI